ncbi:hypothetical protein PoB_007582100, partial [Plakobranchus ocellatus]
FVDFRINIKMISTFLKLGVLVLCLYFVLSASHDDDEKSRLPRFLEIFRKKNEPTMEEQAENVVAGKTRVSKAAEQLSREGKSLQTYIKSLHAQFGDNDKEMKAFIDVLDQVGDHVVRAGEIIKKKNKDISDALTNKMKDVGDVVNFSRRETSDLERFIERSIDDAERALVKVFPRFRTRRQRRIARELREIDHMIGQVVNSLDEVGRDSEHLGKSVVKAGKDMFEVLRRAGERVTQAVTGP